jgi:CBS domain containing-hemolysin-like protein
VIWTGRAGQRGRPGKTGRGDTAMGWLAVAALALIAAAGCCATAEVALLRVSRAGAKELGRTAGERSAPLQAVLAEVPRYLSVLSLAMVAAEAGATVLVTALLLHVIGPGWRAFTIAAAIMIVAVYAATWLVPRSAERQHPARIALAAAAVLHPVVRFLGPLPRFLGAAGRRRGTGKGASGSEEDLRGLVDLLEQRQVIQPGERAMIHSVFELGDTIVREVMVPRTDMVFVERAKTLQQALSLALRSGFSRIPVIGENLDDVVGIAYLKDIVTRSQEHRAGESVEKVSSIMRPATFVPESKPIDELLKELQARQIHLAIVIDEYGGTAGLVTIEDILEEIVGEITDEYDHEQPTVEWIEQGRHARVTARLPVEELEELFDVSIDAADVETVGGLLAQRLGRVPIAGSIATVQGLKLTAESLAGRRNRIGTVMVQRSGPALGGAAAGAAQH